MEEFKTKDGVIKIKESVSLNKWEFPIHTKGRIETIKRLSKKGLSFSGVAHIICKQRAFFNNEFTQQSNEQLLVDALRYKNGCVKVTTKKLILEEPFYDVEQNKTLIYGIEANGEYDVSNNYLRMHGIPVARRVAGRKGVRKHER